MRAIAPAFKIPWLVPERTPARVALAEHQALIDAAEATALELQAHIDGATAIVTKADAALREAESALAEHQRAELSELVETARQGRPLQPKTHRARAAAEARALECRRQADLARQALAEVRIPYDQEAKPAALALHDQLPSAVFRVVAELHADAMGRYLKNLQGLQEAELALRAIGIAVAQEERELRDRGMVLPAIGGAMAQSYSDAPRYVAPNGADLDAAAQRASHFMSRLAGDADARPEPLR